MGEDYLGGKITAYVYLEQNGKNYSMALSKRSTSAIQNTNEALKNIFAKEARKNYKIEKFMEVRGGKRFVARIPKKQKKGLMLLYQIYFLL